MSKALRRSKRAMREDEGRATSPMERAGEALPGLFARGASKAPGALWRGGKALFGGSKRAYEYAKLKLKEKREREAEEQKRKIEAEAEEYARKKAFERHMAAARKASEGMGGG